MFGLDLYVVGSSCSRTYHVVHRDGVDGDKRAEVILVGSVVPMPGHHIKGGMTL